MATLTAEKKQDEMARLWREFVRSRKRELRDRLVVHYLPLVRYHAERLKVNLPPAVELSDLLGSGYVGLIEAINKFDPRRNIKFETFCGQRVRGAMLDDLRRVDWAPRQVRSRAEDLAMRRNAVAARLDRQPAEDEMANELGLSLEEYRELSEMLAVKDQVSIESCQVTSACSGRGAGLESAPDRRVRHPLSAMQRQEMRQAAIRGLQEKEKQVLVMYYYDEMTMREIGSVLGLSESRVCQIHNQVLKFLRRKFEEMGLDGSMEED